jgi:endonuclease/exonuclease/phosphatase family metal-dependent hydrolase
MKIKILTLNIWRYYEWEKRKEKLIRFLKKQDADVILLQEVACDERLKDKWKNQVEEINEKIQYPYLSFTNLMKIEKWHDKPIDFKLFYGFGFLSKYPIKKSEVIILPFVEKNKKFGFMHALIETPNEPVDLINVHFENTDKGSKKHLKQTLNWCKRRKIKPIIAGDFNIKLISDLKDIAEKDYEISYLIKPYKSFLPTKFSNNKLPVTLDYILADKKRFKITKVECSNKKISDHKPVIADITKI